VPPIKIGLASVRGTANVKLSASVDPPERMPRIEVRLPMVPQQVLWYRLCSYHKSVRIRNLLR
jgi:hypothetical protein